ncbi:MAG: hypothetical protein IJM25_01960 [Eubacterium sp.]|nr:hypothetical protein [Eubacterium sp.]
MSYNFNRYDLNTACLNAISNIDDWKGKLELVNKRFSELIREKDFSGKSADAIKNYLQNFTIKTIEIINKIFQSFSSVVYQYAYGFEQFDEFENANLNEEFLTQLINKLDEVSKHVQIMTNDGQGCVNYVSDLLDTDWRTHLYSPEEYSEPIDTEIAEITKLKDGIIEYNNLYVNHDALENVRDLIKDARVLIDKVQNDKVVDISNPRYSDTSKYKDFFNNVQEHYSRALKYRKENHVAICQGEEYLDQVTVERQEEQEAKERLQTLKDWVSLGSAGKDLVEDLLQLWNPTKWPKIVKDFAVTGDKIGKIVYGVDEIVTQSAADTFFDGNKSSVYEFYGVADTLDFTNVDSVKDGIFGVKDIGEDCIDIYSSRTIEVAQNDIGPSELTEDQEKVMKVMQPISTSNPVGDSDQYKQLTPGEYYSAKGSASDSINYQGTTPDSKVEPLLSGEHDKEVLNNKVTVENRTEIEKELEKAHLDNYLTSRGYKPE